MQLPQEIQSLINTLPPESQAVVKAIALICETKVQKLEARVKELEDQLSKNSRNSSKPSSTDGFNKPAPKSLRKKSGKKAGGQKGHKGHTLKMTSTPDHTIFHEVNNCSRCQKDLSKQRIVEHIKRQVYDIPILQIQVTEHISEVKICTCGCRNRAEIPDYASHYVQYGPNLKTFLTYLQDYQLLPYARSAELVEDLFEHKLSQGTLYNMRQRSYEHLEDFETDLQTFLRSANLAGFDETGFRIAESSKPLSYWLHSCSTQDSVLYQVHRRRGQKAMDDIGVLPFFKGIAVHDFWKSYYKYNCTHALCNAHLLRELIFIKERFEQDWAQELIDLLLKMKQSKYRAINEAKTELSSQTLKRYRHQYEEIVKKGLSENPLKEIPPEKVKRGRKPKTKARNLLERFRDFADDILRFFYDFDVPFDNNFSERDLRMMKVKLKISGCFRSLKGAQYFARMRSYVGTARKQGVNAFKAIRSLFTNRDIPQNLISNLYC